MTSMESDQKGLNFLVICRLEKLSAEHQSIARHASIVGFQVNPTFLDPSLVELPSLIPPPLRN